MPPGKTTHDNDFLKVSPGRFEAVVRQLVGNLDGVAWATRPAPIGHLGSDQGQDIRAWEEIKGPKRVTTRLWLAKVKRKKAFANADAP